MLNSLAELKKLDHEIILLNHTCEILRWDQETYLPAKAIDERSEQIALIQGLIHERIVDPRQAELFADLGVSDNQPSGPPSLSLETQAFLRESYRRYRRHTRVPRSLIEEIARQQSLSQAAWAKARQESDYQAFAPYLQRLLELVKEYARCQGFSRHIYDALLDEYEPWMTTAGLTAIFEALREDLIRILDGIREKGAIATSSILKRPLPLAKQKSFNQMLLEAMGFDLNAGRLDISAHPFTTTLGAWDVRLTTRYNEAYSPTSIFGTIHETGHGLYEQGLAEELRGSILGNAPSLGMHESQSRLWENLVGRSLPFWKYFLPILSSLAPETFADLKLEDFYAAINNVSPSPIRVEADEVTYNLHIILRFQLEVKLMEGSLGIADLPEAWRDKSLELLGISPATDKEGVLQDVHWSMGAFGYFPTYALGNLISVQLFTALRNAFTDASLRIACGQLGFIREWLLSNIYQYGAIYPAQELILRATGQKLNPSFFVAYLKQKYGELYGL